MGVESDVKLAESQFFESLLSADRERLEGVLAPEFELIDVMTGSLIPRAALVDVVGSRQLVFESIARLAAHVRVYEDTAVVTGETRIGGRYDGQGFGAHSRYTHVYVRGEEGWRLVSAQGTQVAPVGEPAR